MATNETVPAPRNGSSTMLWAAPVLPGQVQVGCHSFVACFVGAHPVLSTFVRTLNGTCAGSRLLTWPVETVTRSHGAPHCSHALDDEPARMHGSISFGGKVAKWAELYGAVGTVQTERLLRPVHSFAMPGMTVTGMGLLLWKLWLLV